MRYERGDAKMRVLIAEDEASLAKQLTSSISEAGYAVDCAGDGERADFLAQAEQYDAIILDLGLPKIDGLTLLRNWREAGRKRRWRCWRMRRSRRERQDISSLLRKLISRLFACGGKSTITWRTCRPNVGRCSPRVQRHESRRPPGRRSHTEL